MHAHMLVSACASRYTQLHIPTHTPARLHTYQPHYARPEEDPPKMKRHYTGKHVQEEWNKKAEAVAISGMLPPDTNREMVMFYACVCWCVLGCGWVVFEKGCV